MKTLLLIDSSNYLHRAYYATYKKSQTNPYAALETTSAMLLNTIFEWTPDKIVFTFDNPSIFRLTIHPEYKKNRKEKPEELQNQIEIFKNSIKQAGIPYAEDPNNEADDIIGTVATQFQDNHKVLISSTDKDFSQLVNFNINIVKQNKDKIWEKHNPIHITQKYGIPPSKFALYLALIKDANDNIPGIDKIGPVNAKKLILENQTTDQLIQKISEKTKLDKIEIFKQLKFNLALTTIKTDLDIQVQQQKTNLQTIADLQNQKCIGFAENLNKLIHKFGNL